MRMPLTIFTPTYQRAARLPRLYASLQAQTVKSFEWIVIDDGGMDETPELVRAWAASETAFPIRFQKIAHGGKHRAINHAVEMAEGEAFFIVDSDDALYPDAVEHVLAWFAEIADAPQFYDIEVFNQCEQSQNLMVTIECWKDVHPALVTLPVDWDHPIPYGILYAKEPDADVTHFIETVKKAQEKNM